MQLYFKNSTVLESPWRHQIVENFFDNFECIKQASCILEQKYSDTIVSAENCLSLFEVYDDIGKECFDIISDVNISLLKNLKEIVSPFLNYRKFQEYISIPSFHILPANTQWQKIHDEAEDKTISIVVYLYPENSVGTTLYANNSRDSYHVEILWKQNSAMIFCGEKNVTWHDFRSLDRSRVTLNFFLRSCKNISTSETADNYEIKFDNGLVTYVPKHLPDEVLDILFTGKFRQHIVW
jgi:hypothetical protein